MCGRFTLSHSAAEIGDWFGVEQPPAMPHRYNIAPTQPIAVILKTLEHPQRQLKWMRWGLIPSWAKDPSIGNRLINARAETIAEKPSFRAAFQRRRCLIVADGFYEWQRSPQGKQPFYFQLKEHELFAFAGLWEHWQDPTGSEIESCTILTTEANALLCPIHNRMPVLLQPRDYELWLDPNMHQPQQLQSLLKPFPEQQMQAYPVSSRVNDPRHDSPDCIEPVSIPSNPFSQD